MTARTFTLTISALLAGAAMSYGAWAAMRARRDLVTLSVRNMPVRQVVKKIEWQTWERIFVHKVVQGSVTLNVRQMPLEEVLRILGDQTASRASAIYPLYSSGKSLRSLKKALRGEVDPADYGWTNLQGRAFFPGGPIFGAPARDENLLVSLRIQDKDVQFATLALARFARVRVVPEDGTSGLVDLKLDAIPVPDAVAQLAKQAHRSWAKLYLLRGEFGPGGTGGPGGAGSPPSLATSYGTSEPGTPGPAGPARMEMTDAQREALRRQREALEEELQQTLPAAEQQRIEQQRKQVFEDLQSLTPEQRRARFAQVTGGGMDRRNLDRLKNSTPEQRVEQQRRMSEMRKRFQHQPGPPPQPPR